MIPKNVRNVNFLKNNISLEPDFAFEPATWSRCTEQIFFIDRYSHQHFICFHIQKVYR